MGPGTRDSREDGPQAKPERGVSRKVDDDNHRERNWLIHRLRRVRGEHTKPLRLRGGTGEACIVKNEEYGDTSPDGCDGLDENEQPHDWPRQKSDTCNWVPEEGRDEEKEEEQRPMAETRKHRCQQPKNRNLRQAQSNRHSQSCHLEPEGRLNGHLIPTTKGRKNRQVRAT